MVNYGKKWIDQMITLLIYIRLGRGLFDTCRRIVLDKIRIYEKEWNSISYQVFDMINPTLISRLSGFLFSHRCM